MMLCFDQTANILENENEQEKTIEIIFIKFAISFIYESLNQK